MNDLKFTTAGDYVNGINYTISQLAEQAKKKPLGNSWCYANTVEFQQQFAQLIVRECMTNLYLNGYDDAMAQIQSHFEIT